MHNRKLMSYVESIRTENTTRLIEAVNTLTEDNRAIRRQYDNVVKRMDGMKLLLDQVLDRLDEKDAASYRGKVAEKMKESHQDKKSQNNTVSTGACADPADVILVEQVDKNKQEIRQINNTISNLSSNLSDVDLRHQLHENTTYDGRMLWKIDGFKQRMKQAVNNKTTALHSAPVFTKKYGYKFCCRLYLNGDGEANKGKYVSLFFVLMRSEFDNLLEWPFQKSVVFTLKNQLDPSKDFRRSFNADPKSTSFMKPKKQMNPASGCPQFMLQTKLNEEGYVKDNCFYLEIQVQ